MNLPVSRKEALAQGSKHFFTGVPCKHGHLRKRLTSSGRCLSCDNESQKAYAKAPHGRESRNKYRREWRGTPEGREAKRRSERLWRETPKGKLSKKRSDFLRQKRYRLATPSWCDIDALVLFASQCPEGCHVDHIIPLQGFTVCGLHVLENLQYLPAQENLSKQNKIDPFTLEANVCVLPDHREYVAPGPLGPSGF